MITNALRICPFDSTVCSRGETTIESQTVDYDQYECFQISYRKESFVKCIENRYGLVETKFPYSIYDEVKKTLDEWREHQIRKENIDAFYMIFGCPMGGAVGTKEFIDMSWGFVEALGLSTGRDT